MGSRVEGKTKKKSIKAKVTSKFSAKRKLSRMGKKVQKVRYYNVCISLFATPFQYRFKMKQGMAGASAEFVTRSNALKTLQITLKDFRS